MRQWKASKTLLVVVRVLDNREIKYKANLHRKHATMYLYCLVIFVFDPQPDIHRMDRPNCLPQLCYVAHVH